MNRLLLFILVFCFAVLDGKSQNCIDLHGDNPSFNNFGSTLKYELGVNPIIYAGILENEIVGSNCNSVFKNTLFIDNQFVTENSKTGSYITDNNLISLIRKDIFFLSVLRI
jgi:hypothetical protein